MPPPPPMQIRARWFCVTFLSNPYWENLDGSVPCHTNDCEGNHPSETQIQSLWMLGLLDGAPDSANCWQPFMLLCPLLYLLWVTLTPLVSFALEL
jgi:hypothetical protein